MEIGKRMKENYENRSNVYLTRRVPVILRLDGKAFHTYTKDLQKPFDDSFIWTIASTMEYLCQNIQGAKFGYSQSDEISILITDYDNLETNAWLDYNTQKMTSVAASMATAYFNNLFHKEEFAFFDARVFNIPKEEILNYFIWRQKDWERNSLNMFARSFYSHRELLNKKKNDIHEMLHQRNENWANLPSVQKNGTVVIKEENWQMYWDVIFMNNDIINRFI